MVASSDNGSATRADDPSAKAPHPNDPLWQKIEDDFANPRPQKRIDVLWMAHYTYLAPPLPDDTKLEGLRRLLMQGLKDADGGVVYAAWSILEQRHLIDPATVTDDMFIWSDPPGVPEFGLAKAVIRSNYSDQSHTAVAKLVQNLTSHIHPVNAAIPHRTIQPLHSPTYFDPKEYISDSRRKTYLENDLDELRRHINWAGPDYSSQRVISGFFRDYHNSGKLRYVNVLQLPLSRRFLADGHHRTAVLLEAVRRGIMPAEWLDNIPVVLWTYDGPLPEPFVRRILTYGHTLTWDDFLPLPSSKKR